MKRNLFLVCVTILGSALLAALQPSTSMSKTKEAWSVPGQSTERPSIPTLTSVPPSSGDSGGSESVGTPALVVTATPLSQATYSPPEEQATQSPRAETQEEDEATAVIATVTPLPLAEVTQDQPSATPTLEATRTSAAPATLSEAQPDVPTPIVDLMVVGGALILVVIGFILLRRSSESEASD